MGIRIKKAIGYGIPYNDTTKSLFREDVVHYIYESPLKIKPFFQEKYKDFLEMSKDERHRQWTDLMDVDTMLMLLSVKDTDYMAEDFEDCFSAVYDDEKVVGLLFYPISAKGWRRYDDIIDYTWATDNNMATIFEPISLKYRSTGIFPYQPYESVLPEKFTAYDVATISRVDNDVEPGFAETLKKEKKIRNFIPQSLRELVWEMGIFKDPEDIYKLSPYKAEWWS